MRSASAISWRGKIRGGDMAVITVASLTFKCTPPLPPQHFTVVDFVVNVIKLTSVASPCFMKSHGSPDMFSVPFLSFNPLVISSLELEIAHSHPTTLPSLIYRRSYFKTCSLPKSPTPHSLLPKVGIRSSDVSPILPFCSPRHHSEPFSTWTSPSPRRPSVRHYHYYHHHLSLTAAGT